MLDLTPEMKILLTQVDMLRKEYAELFEQRNFMLKYEETTLTSLYLSLIGKHQFRLFCLQGEQAKLMQRIKLAQAYFNRNEVPDWHKIDKEVQAAFKEYQQKIEDEAARLAAANEFFKSGFLKEEDAMQLKSVYKLLVKKLHPDLHPNQSAKEYEMFLNVQAAYDLSDLKAMNEILLYITGMKEEVKSVVIPDLKTTVARLMEMNDVLKDKIDQLQKAFPFCFREKLKDDKWIESENNKLSFQIENTEKEIKEKTEYLLLLKSWKPELLH